jgi:hypothetical protein
MEFVEGEESVNDNEFEDWNEDDETIEVKSLFNNTFYSSIEELIHKELEIYNFNLKEAILQVGFTDQNIIMLINFIRSLANNAEKLDSVFIEELNNLIYKKDFLNNNEFMKPQLNDDPLLYLLTETLVCLYPNQFIQEEDEIEKVVDNNNERLALMHQNLNFKEIVEIITSDK